MHILFLTDNFPPEVNAPATRTFEHCREWVKVGHKVTVVTCAPNFPTGKVFDGYRNRLWQTEETAGIRVVRVWSYITVNEGFLRRSIDYASYMASAITASPFIRDVDLVVGTSPQFFTACAAYVVSRIKRCPFVFELRDLWPHSIRAVGAMDQSTVLNALERVELFLYEKADLIISATHSFRDELACRGIDRTKIQVVTNGVDASRFRPLAKDMELVDRFGLEGKFVAGYVGTHGMAHALETLIDAAEILRRQSCGEAFRFLLLGDGAKKAALVAEAKRRDLGSILFLDSVSREDVTRYWSLIDVSVIHLRRNDLFRTVIPSKLFECMAMGIPVLLGVEGESAHIVQQEDVGLCFSPEDGLALCNGLRKLKEDRALFSRFRKNGPKAAMHYDRAMLARSMLEHIQSVVDQRRVPVATR